MRRTRWVEGVLAVAVVTGLHGGCRRAPQRAPTPSAPAASAPGLPPGHPSIDSGPAVGHGGAPMGVGGLSWTRPPGWKDEPPSSAMRRAQYRVGGPGGEAECVVFYFGAGEGGDPQSNAERWAGQFSRPDGKPAELKMSALKGAPVDVTLVEVVGTYLGGPTMSQAAASSKPDFMLLGAIAKGPDANWFFKFTGPAATVRPQRTAFEGMLRSLKQAP